MPWIPLCILSALFLGVYDLLKKFAVRDNAVAPVLFLNVATAALIYSPIIAACKYQPEILSETVLWVKPVSLQQHLMLFAKSCLVGASWTLAFFGLKHLPISIATPIRATSPLWTILIAVLVFQERPSRLQWLGIVILSSAFLLFSLVGKREGLHFARNRWIFCMLGATMLGSCSALYDKFLLQQSGLPPATVQAWFSIYLVPVMSPLALRWLFIERRAKPFQWRWSIPGIAIVLLIADLLYFTAISDPQALIAIISPVRRTAVVIPFLFGILWLGEKNWRSKGLCILLMLLGVLLVSRPK